MDAEGWYLGPVPKDCGHNNHSPLIQRADQPSGVFQTSGTGSYPWGMCMTLARAILHDEVIMARVAKRTLKPIPAGGNDDKTASKRPVVLRARTVVERDEEKTQVKRKGWTLEGGRWKRHEEFTPTAEDAARDDAEESEDSQEQDPCLPELPLGDEGASKSLCHELDPTSGEDSDGEPIPPCGAGWWGKGLPMMLNVGANKDPSPMEDGGGLCSPGRWKIAQRRLPEELGARVSRKLLLVLEHWGAQKYGGLRGLCY